MTITQKNKNNSTFLLLLKIFYSINLSVTIQIINGAIKYHINAVNTSK